jgi:hypothetical protein
VSELQERQVLDGVLAERILAIWQIGSKAAHDVEETGWSQLDAFAMILVATRILEVSARGRVGTRLLFRQ